MKSLKFPESSDWFVFGEMLDINPETTSNENFAHLSGDIIFISSDENPNKAFVILDVSWLPDSDPNGNYYCRIIIKNDWDNPKELFETRDTKLVYD